MACYRAYAGIRVRDHDRSKGYPHTTIILGLTFQNLATKITVSKEFPLKQSMLWISKSLFKYPILFKQRFQNPKLYPNQPLFAKNDFQKGQKFEKVLFP